MSPGNCFRVDGYMVCFMTMVDVSFPYLALFPCDARCGVMGFPCLWCCVCYGVLDVRISCLLHSVFFLFYSIGCKAKTCNESVYEK